MKTKNNTQKTALNSLAVISLVLISFTASALDLQKPFIENETCIEMLTMVDKGIESQPASSAKPIFTDTNSLTTYLKTESENTLVLEEWMSNAKLFNMEQNPTKKKTIKTATFVFEETEDSKLEFEAWMFNPKYWRVGM